MPNETQEKRVLGCLLEGPATSAEISAEIGLPLKHVSAYLHAAWKRGKILRDERRVHTPGARSGAGGYLWRTP